MDSNTLKILTESYDNRNYDDFVINSVSPKVGDFKPSPEELKLMWAALGLSSEAGEVSAVLEKAIRKKGKIEKADYEHLYDELSDVLFWVQACLNLIPGTTNMTLDNLSKYNMEKLIERQKRNEVSKNS